MKIHLLLLLIISFSLSFCKQKKKVPETDAVKAVVDSFYYSYMRDDFSNMSAYVTDDINYIASSGEWFKDRKQLQDSISKLYEHLAMNTPVSIDTMSVRFVTNDVAIVNLVEKTGFYPGAMTREANELPGTRIARTMVMVKQNGKWLLAQNQSTLMDERPQTMVIEPQKKLP